MLFVSTGPNMWKHNDKLSSRGVHLTDIIFKLKLYLLSNIIERFWLHYTNSITQNFGILKMYPLDIMHVDSSCFSFLNAPVQKCRWHYWNLFLLYPSTTYPRIWKIFSLFVCDFASISIVVVAVWVLCWCKRVFDKIGGNLLRHLVRAEFIRCWIPVNQLDISRIYQLKPPLTKVSVRL